MGNQSSQLSTQFESGRLSMHCQRNNDHKTATDLTDESSSKQHYRLNSDDSGTSLFNANQRSPTYVVSDKVALVAFQFWNTHIDSLVIDRKLEIGCAMYFSIMLTNQELKVILKKNSKSIESLSLKFLDMIGWLFRSIMIESVDVHLLLNQLGQHHFKMGINKIEYFTEMLRSIHETMQYYFPTHYTMEVKYAIDQIFSVSTQIMCGGVRQFSKSKDSTNLDFLKSIETCLSSTIGREYLFHYLQQVRCDEVVVFYRILVEFKSKTTDKERYITAKKMVKACIKANGPFVVNINAEIRRRIIGRVKVLRPLFVLNSSELSVSNDLFVDAEEEMERKIWSNHWKHFCKSLQSMYMSK